MIPATVRRLLADAWPPLVLVTVPASGGGA